MPSVLKIGLVLDTSLDPPDGVQQYVIGVGEWLRHQGHDVHYLVGETDRTDLPNIHSLARNFKVRFNGNRTTIPLPTSRRKFRKFLAAEDFDVLHVQTPHSPFMAARLINAASTRTAVVATFHVLPDGRLPLYGNYLLGFWLKRSLKRIDTMLCVSSSALDFMQKTFRVSDARVLPNVFDYRRFNKAKILPKYYGERKTILFLGRLVERKGCMTLLKAVAELQTRGVTLPDYRVVICGRGPLEAQLKKFVHDNNLDSVVEFTGFISEEDKPRYYASADISVFPAYGGESFGIVLIEAMASGHAAVLGGDNPGYKTVLEPKPELLFDARDAKALADKIAYYLTHDPKRASVAKWGSEYTRKFDTAVVGEQLVEIYNSVLRKRR